MSYTQDDIDKLEQAIGTGALKVKRGEEEVTYRSLQEMRQALSAMRAQVRGSQRGPILRQLTPHTNRGL